MADRVGRACALTVLAPVRPGREASLRGALAALPSGAGSPLARVPGTHFARWVVVPALPEAGGRAQLLFTSCVDAPLERWLHGLVLGLGSDADAIWGCCEGYPGRSPAASLVAWLRRYRVRTSFFVAAYPTASVDDVRAALADRAALAAFAVRAQGMDDAELHAAFLRELVGVGAERVPA
jgi:hypothetical protein